MFNIADLIQPLAQRLNFKFAKSCRTVFPQKLPSEYTRYTIVDSVSSYPQAFKSFFLTLKNECMHIIALPNFVSDWMGTPPCLDCG